MLINDIHVPQNFKIIWIMSYAKFMPKTVKEQRLPGFREHLEVGLMYFSLSFSHFARVN